MPSVLEFRLHQEGLPSSISLCLLEAICAFQSLGRLRAQGSFLRSDKTGLANNEKD